MDLVQDTDSSDSESCLVTLFSTATTSTSTPIATPASTRLGSVIGDQFKVANLVLREQRGNEGDVEKHYIVCFRILSLDSPVFRNLYRTSPNRNLVEIVLERGQLAAMDNMLRALHYGLKSKDVGTNVKDLASFAMLCRKYECSEALSSWTTDWASRCDIWTPKHVGCLLLAAECLDSHSIQAAFLDYLDGLSMASVQEWHDDDGLALLSLAKISKLLSVDFVGRCADHGKDWTMVKVMYKIQNLQRVLYSSVDTTWSQQSDGENELLGSERGAFCCYHCNKDDGESGHRCTSCRNYYVKRRCDNDHRLYLHLKLLKDHKLWPCDSLLTTVTPTRLRADLVRATKSLQHSCQLNDQYPLQRVLSDMAHKVQAI